MKDLNSKESIKIIDHHFDNVMEEIGWFGAFTLRLYIVMYLSIIFGAMNIVGAVFLLADVPYHCEINSQIVDYTAKVSHKYY